MSRLLGRGLLLLGVLAPIVASAQSADEILKMAEGAQRNFADRIVESKMEIREPGRAEVREFAFTTTEKGESKRLVRFTAPAGVKGIGMLTEGPDTRYVYLPAFQRVRRLGTHVKSEPFIGSDFTYAEMAEATYGGLYRPTLLAAESTRWILELSLLPGREAEFPRLKIWVDRTHHRPLRIEFFDAAGKKARTMTREDYRKDEGPGDHLTPATVTLVEHRRNNHSTTIRVVRARVNSGVPDDAFTERGLVRGY